MQNTSKRLEAQCTATINHDAPNLQTYQCAGWENIELHALKRREKLKLHLMMWRNARASRCLGRTSHEPRPTSTELLSVITQIPQPACSFHAKTVSGRKVSRNRTQMPSCKGTTGSPPPPHSSFATHLCPPLPTHRLPHGRVFTSLRNQASS